MTAAEWRDRITIDPAVHHGDPCIKGIRTHRACICGILLRLWLSRMPQEKFTRKSL